jgi:hypothetical protein
LINSWNLYFLNFLIAISTSIGLGSGINGSVVKYFYLPNMTGAIHIQ